VDREVGFSFRRGDGFILPRSGVALGTDALRRRRSAVPVAFRGCRSGPGTSLPPSPSGFLGLGILGSSTDQPEPGRDQGEADAFFPAEVLAQEGGG